MKDNHKEEDVSEASDVMTSNENSISESGTNPVKMLEPEENISTTSDISPSSADVDEKTNVNINAENHVNITEDMIIVMAVVFLTYNKVMIPNSIIT